MEEHRPLILRGNRFLGSALVDQNLLGVSALEEANEKVLELVKGGNYKRASLLSVLCYELKVLEEPKLIEHLVETMDVGLVDLRDIDMSRFSNYGVDPGLCWATMCVPFESVEGFWCVATAHYLSEPVRKHWEKLNDNDVLWYVASLESITEALERIEKSISDGEQESSS